MKKLRFFGIVLISTLFLLNSCDKTMLDEPVDDQTLELKSANTEKQSYIVVLNDAELDAELTKLKGYEKKQEAVKSKTAKILSRAGITDGEVDYVYGTAVKGFSVKIPPGQLNKLESDASVKYVEKSQVISLSIPKIKEEGDVSASADTYPWGIVRVNGGVDCTGKVAWVIDSGIDLDHPDLNVDASRGAYYVSRVSSPDDDNGHGSHCAGIIAAKADGAGVIGVAANATVIPVKVLDKRGSGTTDGVIAGVDFVAENASSGDVANMSLGGGVSTTLDAAVLAASSTCKFILAAGNESDDADSHSPARVNGPNVYTISAMAEGDIWASYSNYGTAVDYCTPGSSIYSTYKSGGYATMSGTSMAAPHAAGILLVGSYTTDGVVSGDPDGDNDAILVVDDGGITPPENQAPNASFTFTTDNLIADFTDTSSDSDGSVVSWAWTFGDGGTATSQNPTYTYSADGTYSVSLTVTDDDGATDSYTSSVTVSEGTSGGDITLTATGYKQRGIRYVSLTWSGATGSSVNIKIGGVTETTTTNDGEETINMGRVSGTFVFTVCETDGSACSNDATVVI